MTKLFVFKMAHHWGCGTEKKHLKDGCHCQTPVSAEHAIHASTDVKKFQFCGKIRPVSIFVCDAEIVALNNKSSGVFPVAVLEIVRRICSETVCSRLSNAVAGKLYLSDFGVGVQQAREVVIHCIKAILDQQQFFQPDSVLAKIDICNAVRLVGRRIHLRKKTRVKFHLRCHSRSEKKV